MWRCGSPECNCEGNRQRCLDGDQASANALATTLTPLVDATLRKLLPYSRPDEREDVRQEVFLRMFKKLRQWKGDRFFCIWVKQIAIRSAYDQMRINRRLKRLSRAADDAERIVDPKPQPLSPEVWKCVDRTLESLDENLRRAYELHVKQGMTVEQTATAMGQSVRNIYNWLAKVRERLLSCLD
jgi:RNA polymerase sigma-70 factor (ECF subfamily)